MTTTTNLALNQPAYNSSAWDVPLNANEDILDAAFGNTTSVALTNTNVTLTSTQCQAMQIKFTGAISANIIITVPAIGGRWTFTNATSGAYSVTIASAGAGTSVAIPQGYSTMLFSDGTNIVLADGGVLQGGNLSTLTVSGTATFNGASTFNSTAAFASTTTYSGAATFNSSATFNGSTSALGVNVKNIAETITTSATAATGTINYDVTTQSVLYYTVNSSANFTINIRGNSTTTLNSILSTGQAITVVFMNTNGSTAYYNNAVTIDGSSVTPKWQGGTAPTFGNASSIDIYTYTVIKTASATYTVLASQVQFA